MAKNKDLCKKCTGLCCRYFALPIETPEDKEDYDDIRWYLCHEGITIFVEDDEWYMNIDNKCKYLSEKDYTCQIYDKRPRICKKYTTKDCDFIEGEYDYDLYFTSPEQMEEYIKIKFDNNNRKKRRRKTGKRAKGKSKKRTKRKKRKSR